MNDRAAIEKDLIRLGAAPDTSFALLEAALRLGALDAAAPDLDTCRGEAGGLVARVQAFKARTADDQAQALAQALHRDAGYDGDRDTYDHPDNANLVHVLTRRRGLPVALGILYIHVGEAAGFRLHGLDAPGDFVLRLEAFGERRLIDPFNGGAVIDAPRLRELVKQAVGPAAEIPPLAQVEMTKRAVLLRLLNNIKVRALAGGQLDRAVETLRRMSLVAPAVAALWFERGVLEDQMDHLAAAAQAFAVCRERADTPRLREQAEAALARLQRRLN